eukprot:TRINITY_DN99863_c0_g1_i1.p1 TRINITY_DN99863_c0_g1~~TRINITY_DN99863_c0_g1_i1.p1  ORF type:complete len:209 (-),score=44.42 TRINITY_DN99863_c0_g1_i1:47-622(-)
MAEAEEELPGWLSQDAKLTYVSRSSGKAMDVTVKQISRSKKVVTLVFARDGKSEMQVPFNQISAKNSPLKPAIPEEAGEVDFDKFMDRFEGKWHKKTENLDPKISLGADIKNFSFQGPSAPQMMEILSSPEPERESTRKEAKKASRDGKDKGKDKPKDDREKEKAKQKSKEKVRARKCSRSQSRSPERSRK